MYRDVCENNAISRVRISQRHKRFSKSQLVVNNNESSATARTEGQVQKINEIVWNDR